MNYRNNVTGRFAKPPYPSKLSIGQQVRIVDYDHAHCGKFVKIRHVTASGRAALGTIMFQPTIGWVGFTNEQVIL